MPAPRGQSAAGGMLGTNPRSISWLLPPAALVRPTLSAEAADGQALSTDIRRGEPGRGGFLRDPPARRVTWDAFAELVERNNGVYGGCWCIAHHSEYQRGVSDPRTLKEELVRAGRAHAALVFDEDDLAQGWCQYGSPEELGLKHHREYAKNPPPRARWRIACIFVDKGHRGRGVARAGLGARSPRSPPRAAVSSRRSPR